MGVKGFLKKEFKGAGKELSRRFKRKRELAKETRLEFEKEERTQSLLAAKRRAKAKFMPGKKSGGKGGFEAGLRGVLDELSPPRNKAKQRKKGKKDFDFEMGY